MLAIVIGVLFLAGILALSIPGKNEEAPVLNRLVETSWVAEHGDRLEFFANGNVKIQKCNQEDIFGIYAIEDSGKIVDLYKGKDDRLSE